MPFSYTECPLRVKSGTHPGGSLWSVVGRRADTYCEGCHGYDRMRHRIDAMYIDKLDGKIGGDFFDRMAGGWRVEQIRCLRDIERHQDAQQSCMAEGIKILELARNAQALLERQPAREKRRLLNFVLSNCSWEDGELIAEFRQPFDLLVETAAASAQTGGKR
jgi:site-specific DNA recombinase